MSKQHQTLADAEITPAKLRKKRAELRALGINLREFCATHAVDYQAARELMCGAAKAYRGKRHAAAVALGLKPDPKTLKI